MLIVYSADAEQSRETDPDGTRQSSKVQSERRENKASQFAAGHDMAQPPK